jgi:hypothetical protein
VPAGDSVEPARAFQFPFQSQTNKHIRLEAVWPLLWWLLEEDLFLKLETLEFPILSWWALSSMFLMEVGYDCSDIWNLKRGLGRARVLPAIVLNQSRDDILAQREAGIRV